MNFSIYSKYFYSKLTIAEKKIYIKLQESWLNYKERTTIKISSNVDIKRIIDAIIEDTPELFYLDVSAISVSQSSMHAIVRVRFLYSKYECIAIKAKISQIVNDIVDNSENSCDKEKFIHDYLVDNIDYSLMPDNVEAHSIVGAFISKKAVCEGYARAFKLLCDACKIPCIIVSGIASNGSGSLESHAWNIVRIKDCTYHVDVTWNCSSKFIDSIPFYYNVSDEFMRKDHMWETNKWPPCTTKGSIEKNIIRISSSSVLDKELFKVLKKRKDFVFVEFTKVFSSSADIEKLLSNCLNRIGARKIIFSYGIVFGSKLDCVLLNLKYS